MDFLKLIQEGRVDDFKAKYTQKFGEENVKRILSMVPQKYLDWVGKHLDMVNFEDNFSKVAQGLKKFEKISSNLPITDLYQYKNVGQLLSALSDYDNKQRRTVKKVEGGNVVYDDGRFFVVNPLTHDSSCYYGKGTKWCTAADTDHQFNRYNVDGKLFYILDRSAPTDDKFYKVALLQKFDGDKTYYDAKDETVKSGWILGTNKLNEILNSVNEYLNTQFAEQIKIFSDKEEAKKERARLESLRLAQEKRRKLDEAEERRLDGEWTLGPDCPEEGLKAHALLDYLVDENEVEIITNEDREEIQNLENQIEALQAEYDNDEEVRTDLLNEIQELEDEISELKNKIDVYNIIPDGTFYETTQFKVIGAPNVEDNTYAVGDEVDMHNSCVETLEQLIDDIGYEGFNESFVREYIDEDAFVSYAEDLYNDDVYENPEVYLGDEDRHLSRKQEEQIRIYEDKIEKTKEFISRLEGEMDGEHDEEIEEKIEELNDQITDMETEIEDIKDDPEGDYDEDAIEDVISSRVDEVRYDIEGFMSEWGLEYKYYINKDDFIEGIIDADGYGHTLNGYDGSADEYTVEGQTFWVMRID